MKKAQTKNGIIHGKLFISRRCCRLDKRHLGAQRIAFRHRRRHKLDIPQRHLHFACHCYSMAKTTSMTMTMTTRRRIHAVLRPGQCWLTWALWGICCVTPVLRSPVDSIVWGAADWWRWYHRPKIRCLFVREHELPAIWSLTPTFKQRNKAL